MPSIVKIVPEASLLNPVVVKEIVGFWSANVVDDETIIKTENNVTSKPIKSLVFGIRFYLLKLNLSLIDYYILSHNI